MLNILKKNNSKIIFDFDDAIYLNFLRQKSNFTNTQLMLKASGWLTVSSKILADFCNNQGFFNVTVINTPVETNRIFISQLRNTTSIVIGWIGSPFTSPYLKIIEPALQKISNHFNIKLLLIGCQKQFTIDGVSIEKHIWQYEKEPEILLKMDIGIMPLPSDDYSKGKGGYKLFQYMAAGIPVIASPVGINSERVIHGQNGFLATTNEEWEKYLSFLIEHPEERKRMGRIGRKMAEEKYNREFCAELLITTIKPLLTQ